MELLLVYDVPAQHDGAVTVAIAVRRRGTVHTAQLFQRPLIGTMGIRLLNESERFQQWLVVNPFPARLSFASGSRSHHV
jgi:hypothetical protein